MDDFERRYEATEDFFYRMGGAQNTITEEHILKLMQITVLGTIAGHLERIEGLLKEEFDAG